MFTHSLVPTLLRLPHANMAFEQRIGALVIQLKSYPSNVPGVHLLGGSYHIADGDTSTSNDLLGTLQGMYIESAGLIGFGTTGSLAGLEMRWAKRNTGDSTDNATSASSTTGSDDISPGV